MACLVVDSLSVSTLYTFCLHLSPICLLSNLLLGVEKVLPWPLLCNVSYTDSKLICCCVENLF